MNYQKSGEINYILSSNELELGPSNTKKKRLEDYEFLINENSKGNTSVLGKGSYGSVKKIRDKYTGEIFALKIVNFFTLTKKSKSIFR